MATPAAFIDRDNTLITNTGDLGDPALVELTDGAAGALARLQDSGYELVVVTNQAGVARGLFTEDDVEAVHDRIVELLDEASGRPGMLSHFYYCPWHPEGTVNGYRREHPWRKPEPGMLYAAEADLDLDLANSWIIGDKPRDVEAGRGAGCHTILLSTDSDVISQAGPDASAPNLAAAVDVILAQRV
jgi:D-glycero-D-manno-heptose 1,7-bisphosphate phosphatase